MRLSFKDSNPAQCEVPLICVSSRAGIIQLEEVHLCKGGQVRMTSTDRNEGSPLNRE
jgi:hypothetical protein